MQCTGVSGRKEPSSFSAEVASRFKRERSQPFTPVHSTNYTGLSVCLSAALVNE